MRPRRLSPLALGGLVALACALALPAAAGATAKGTKGKLWTVSLSGSAVTEESATTPNVTSQYGPDSGYPQPPSGCIANTTATYRLHAAARISAKPIPSAVSPGLGIDNLYVTVFLSGLDASASDRIDGSWVVDPNYSPPGSFSTQPVDPSVCAGFYYDSTDLADGYVPSPVRCPDGTSAAMLASEFGDVPYLDGDLHTNLQTRAVLGLRKGGSVSASGKIAMPEYSFSSYVGTKEPDGTEVLAYKLTVNRVR